MASWSLPFGSRTRKRSFTLPSFRKPAPDDQSDDTGATVRNRKAAAWQWHSRGMGEPVLPTKRPVPSASGASGVSTSMQPENSAGTGSERSKPADLVNQLPPLVATRTASSRFKAEASGTSTPVAPAAATPSATPHSPRTLLYDDLELSGFTSQMADFVQRLQHTPPSPQLKMKPQGSGTASTSDLATKINHLQSVPHSAAALPTERAVVEPAASRRSPMGVLQRLFRKVVRVPKDATSARSAAAIDPDGELLPEDSETEGMRYHYHHYIHHHHHHYHYSPSPDQEMDLSGRRRHSESSGIRPRVSLSPCAELEEGYDDEDEDSAITTFLSKGRRFSDSAFVESTLSKDEKVPDVAHFAKKLADLQLPKRRNSERFTASGNKQPTKVEVGHVEQLGRWQNADAKSRRRHSSESFREEGAANVRWSMKSAWEDGAVMARKVAGGGLSGGGVYKLGAAGAPVGGRLDGVRGRLRSESLDASSRRAKVLAQRELLFGLKSPANVGGGGGEYEMQKGGHSTLLVAHSPRWRQPAPAAQRQPRPSPLPPAYPG